MKKTLVAVAAMAAVTGAMAEVTISGFIDQAYNTTRSTTAAGVSTTQTSLGSNAIGQDSIGFGMSEDLGNGITATANINLIGSTTTGWNGVSTDNGSGIGLKGAFGSFALGQGYSLVWKTSNSSDASGWGTGVGNVHGVGAGSSPGGGMGYTLPEFISGLSLTVEKGLGETDGSRNGDYQGMNATYSVGGFMASYSTGQYKAKGTAVLAAITRSASSAAAAAQTGEWVTVPGVGNVAATTEAVTAGSKSSISALALTYDFGVAKAYFGYNSNQSGGDTDQSQNSSTYGISIPVGAASIGVATSNANYKSAAATTTTVTGTRLLAKYAFSKRTAAYFQYGVAKISAGASATGNGIGLTHNF